MFETFHFWLQFRIYASSFLDLVIIAETKGVIIAEMKMLWQNSETVIVARLVYSKIPTSIC